MKNAHRYVRDRRYELPGLDELGDKGEEGRHADGNSIEDWFWSEPERGETHGHD